MDRIWAPWRLGYIQGQEQPVRQPVLNAQWLEGADRGCFLCRAAAEREDRENLVIDRSPRTLVLLNRYPYSNGHLLLAPLRHVATLLDLTGAEHEELGCQLAKMTDLLQRQLRAEGFNVGLNLGSVAGAGVPGHLHWHVVPRWSGDTNFMPTLAGVRVIPQSLEALWEQLTQSPAH